MSPFKDLKLNLDLNSFLFLFILLASFLSTSSFRTDHYQELDSRLAYTLLQHDPSRVAKYVSGSYFEEDPNNVSISNSFFTLSEIIDKSPDWVLLELKGKQFFEEAVRIYNQDAPYPKTPEEIKTFINKVIFLRPHISDIPAWGAYRILISNVFNSLGLHPLIESVLDFPLSSTYSIGSGFFYSIIYSLTDDYASFLSLATLLTQFLAHLAVLFLFFTLIHLGIPRFYSALASVLSLFSISLYSYGFHLGSTTYALFTFSLFFWAVSSFARNEYYFTRLGALSGSLIFLNTLMAIPILTLLVVHFGSLSSKEKRLPDRLKKLLSNLFFLIKKQKLAIFLTSSYIFLFFQPGQGPRGNIDSPDILLQFYYSFLNLTGWFNEYDLTINNIQFGFFLLLLSFGVYGLVFSKILVFLRRNVFYLFLVTSLTIYGILEITGFLNFTPSRHILFLKVFLTYFYAFGLFFLLKNIRLFDNKIIQFSLISFLAMIGLFNHQNRFDQMQDPFHTFILPSDIDLVISPIPDGFNKVINIPIKNAKYFNFDTTPGTKILYLSQITNFNDWLESSNLSEQQKESIVNVELLSSISDSNSFMPFSAESPKFNFSFNRGNGLYATKFHIDKGKNK